MFFKRRKQLFLQVIAPVSGQVLPIEQTPDEMFAKKMIGDGVCINPTSGTVVSPFDGVVVAVMQHAVGLKSKNGFEILIHFGLETVNLNGEGLTTLVKQGDKVKVGTKLMEVNLEFVKQNVPSVITPVIITNIEDRVLYDINYGEVQAGQDNLFKVGNLEI